MSQVSHAVRVVSRLARHAHLGSGPRLISVGEQISAALSAGSDKRTPVAPVAPFADDPQESWPAEVRTVSGPCCRKAPFAQLVCPFPPSRPAGRPFPHG